MAKPKRRVLRARKVRREDDSLLIRSAETLGRVIGSLQRQIHGGAKRVSSLADEAMEQTSRAAGTRKRAAAPKPSKTGKRPPSRTSSRKR
jgi:hypothetical protein